MIFNTKELLSELKLLTNSHIEFAKVLQTKPEGILQQKNYQKSWSVIECIEHLNLYAAFYNLEITKRLKTASKVNSKRFKSGYLGNKSALDMLPKQEMKTMNTFKSKNPIHSKLDTKKVLTDFITYQEELLDLLDNSSDKDLTKTKTSLTIPLLKFRLGDTFRFVIYHNERHVVQAKNTLKNFQ